MPSATCAADDQPGAEVVDGAADLAEPVRLEDLKRVVEGPLQERLPPFAFEVLEERHGPSLSAARWVRKPRPRGLRRGARAEAARIARTGARIRQRGARIARTGARIRQRGARIARTGARIGKRGARIARTGARIGQGDARDQLGEAPFGFASAAAGSATALRVAAAFLGVGVGFFVASFFGIRLLVTWEGATRTEERGRGEGASTRAWRADGSVGAGVGAGVAAGRRAPARAGMR